MTGPLSLRGRHIALEPLTVDHLDALLEAATADRSTFAFSPVPADPASMATYIAKGVAAREAGLQVPFVTRRLADDRVVGSTRFYNLETWDWSSSLPGTEAGRSGPGPDVANIGYTWLVPGAQRSPINSEAKLLMLGHAFEVWGVRVVRIQSDVRNERSRRAIERLGHQLDGIIRAERPAADGGVRDTALYSMLSAEWPAARARLLERLDQHDQHDQHDR